MSNIKKFIVLTDIHGKKENFTLIKEDLTTADLVILCGDITHFGERENSKIILEELEKYNCNIIGVIGNCDFPAVGKYLTEKDYNISKESASKFGITFIGLSGSLKTPAITPNEYHEGHYREELKWKLLSTKPRNEEVILVTHQPPYGTINDKVPSGVHSGSLEIRRFIEEIQPLICLTGHIHEGTGMDYIGKTLIVNPGAFRSGYHASIEIDIASFDFDIYLKQIKYK